MDRKNLGRPAGIGDAGAFKGGGTCGLFEELASLLESRARPDTGSGLSVCPL